MTRKCVLEKKLAATELFPRISKLFFILLILIVSDPLEITYQRRKSTLNVNILSKNQP